MADLAVPVLPEPVRRQVTELAALALGELAEVDTPVSLRKVRDFAPARRARSGAGPLAVAVDKDAAFRHRVAAAWRAMHPELAQMLDDGELPATADPDVVLAGLYLLRPPGWQDLCAAARLSAAESLERRRREEDDSALRAQTEAAQAEVTRLQQAFAEQQQALAALQDELAGARRELRRQRSEADRARAAARQSQQQAQADAERLARIESDAEAAQQAALTQLAMAEERAEHARRAAREGRSLADARTRLLLDTVVEAATGLRRELALPPVDLRPADLVLDDATADGASLAGRRVDHKGAADDDPALLAELLTLPQAHLIVDGYNVTKTGYGTLPLVEQRRRLVEALAVLAARTASEVTCCFDGAEVEASGATRKRSVRVLFSKPGVTADELIRRLVRAEPAGRPVVVVSSDAEVVRDVCAAGARTVASSALLRMLARG